MCVCVHVRVCVWYVKCSHLCCTYVYVHCTCVCMYIIIQSYIHSLFANVVRLSAQRFVKKLSWTVEIHTMKILYIPVNVPCYMWYKCHCTTLTLITAHLPRVLWCLVPPGLLKSPLTLVLVPHLPLLTPHPSQWAGPSQPQAATPHPPQSPTSQRGLREM